MDAEITAAVYRPRNTNLNAYTETGGFRTDDPMPRQLPASAFGEGQVVVIVTPLNDQTLAEYLAERFFEMGVRSRGWRTVGKYQVDFTLKGVNDANEVAAAIDFGDVVSINVDQGQVEVKADPSRLPQPELPIIKSPFGPTHNYTAQQLVDHLVSWSAKKREFVCHCLGKMTELPESQKAQVVAALQIRAGDTNHFVQQAARQAIQRVTGSRGGMAAGSRQRPSPGVMITLPGDFAPTRADEFGKQLALLTGAISHSFGFAHEHGYRMLTIHLNHLDDTRIASLKLKMFDVVSASTEKKRVRVRLREDSLEALAKAVQHLSESDMSAAEDAPLLSSLLTDAAPLTELDRTVNFKNLGMTMKIPSGFTREDLGPISWLKNARLKTRIEVLLDGTVDVRKFSTQDEVDQAKASGGTVLNYQETNLHGRKAWLTRLRNKPTGQGSISRSSVCFRVPQGIAVVSIGTDTDSGPAVTAQMDAVLNSITFE